MKQIYETGFKLLQLIMALHEGHSMMLGSIALLGLANMVLFSLYQRKRKWTYVGNIDELYVMPMKACKPKSVPVAYFSQLGLVSGPYIDRKFMLINEK